MRQMFGLDAISMLERRQNGAGPFWYVAASAGEQPPEGPGADVKLPVSDTFTLAARGPVPSRADLRVLFSCAAQVAAGLSDRRVTEQRDSRQAAGLGSRAALLAATGESAHEQLTAARVALTALTAEDPGQAVLLADARRAVDRVGRLVDDLRDLSRLHAGAVETYLRPVDLDEVLADCLDDLGPGRRHITVSLAQDLPEAIADGALLTRILTSLLADALQRGPDGPLVAAVARDGQVEIRITDHGPDLDDVSLAFRLARDLTEVMGDTLHAERVPGGGRSVIVSLPAAASVLSTAGQP
jgi:two-component system sensor histidine kinase KdpD